MLHCNFDEIQILRFFWELKSIYDTDGDQELILFNNKEIQIGGRTVFYQDWFDQGVYSICDILDSVGM